MHLNKNEDQKKINKWSHGIFIFKIKFYLSFKFLHFMASVCLILINFNAFNNFISTYYLFSMDKSSLIHVKNFLSTKAKVFSWEFPSFEIKTVKIFICSAFPTDSDIAASFFESIKFQPCKVIQDWTLQTTEILNKPQICFR